MPDHSYRVMVADSFLKDMGVAFFAHYSFV
jgi:hypothetical protein